MDKQKQPFVPLDLDEEELRQGIEELDVEDAEPIAMLPTYVPLRRG